MKSFTDAAAVDFLVLDMAGVGTTLGPQLIAEIGDVSRFSHKGALTAYAGVDPGANNELKPFVYEGSTHFIFI